MIEASTGRTHHDFQCRSLLHAICRPLLAAALIVIFAAAARPQDGPRQMRPIVEAFVQLTLTAEYATKDYAGGFSLTRWEKPISWTIIGRLPPSLRKQVDVIFKEAGSLTDGQIVARYSPPVALRGRSHQAQAGEVDLVDAGGIHVQLYFSSTTLERPVVTTYLSNEITVVAAGNVVILYGARPYLRKLANALPGQSASIGADISSGRADCIAATWTTPRSDNIAHAVVLIADDLSPAILSRCLWEEIGQTLGIRNDLDDADYSIFSNKPGLRPERWTSFDQRTIQLLYDRSLRPGMSEEAVRMALPGLVPKYFDVLPP